MYFLYLLLDLELAVFFRRVVTLLGGAAEVPELEAARVEPLVGLQGCASQILHGRGAHPFVH